MGRYFAFSYIKKKEEKCSQVPWRHLLWSFKVLEAGVWPMTDFQDRPLGALAGQPLAKDDEDPIGFSAVLLFCKGDLEFMANDIGLPHWGSAVPDYTWAHTDLSRSLELRAQNHR